MEMFFTYSILVTYFASTAYSANILAFVPCPMYSHQVAFHDLWKQLSLRGHKVTLITTDPQRNEELTNLTEIDVSWSYKFFTNVIDDAEKTLSPWNFHQFHHDTTYVIAEAQLSHPQIQDIIHAKNKQFDVIFVEFMYPEYLGFAVVYNCPVILISSLDVFTNIHQAMGNPSNPVLYPNIGAPFQVPLAFKGRIINTIYYLYTSYFYNYVSYPKKQAHLSKFFNTTSTVNDLLKKIDLMFLYVNPVVQPVRAIGPTTVNIEGLREFSNKPLPNDLAQFLDNATNGVVYFSLGSSVKSKNLHQKSLEAIVSTFNELPYKFLWKFEAEPENLPFKLNDNVKLTKWAPQQSILAHPNIKAFVTQGGLQSMEESIYNKVPCIVIPFFSDQHHNAKLMKSKGFAITVGRYPHIKKEELKNAIIEVINNTRYKNAVERIKRLSFDTPMTGLEKAIWWTEYVIRNKGAKYLRNPAADLPLYQYYLLDVIGFLIFAIVAVLLVILVSLKKIFATFIACFSNRFDLFNKKIQ